MKRPSQSGSILMLALWATALLASIGVAQATRLSLQYRWVDRLREGNQARLLAVSAFQLAAHRLTTADPVTDNAQYDAPKESWGQLLKKPLQLSSGTIRYQITDEQAKIPINAAPADYLTRLPGFSQAAVNQVITDRALGKRITHPGQLPLLPGFDADQLTPLMALATVYGQGPVNLNTASSESLSLLGFSAGLMTPLLQYRLGPDQQAGTADDGVFAEAGTAGVETALKSFFGQGFSLPEPDKQIMDGLFSAKPPLLGVRSSVYAIDAEGVTRRRAVVRKISAIVDSGGTVKGWHEN